MKKSLNIIRLTALLFCGSMTLPALAGEILLMGDLNPIISGNPDNNLFFQNVFNGKSVANYSNYSLSSFAGISGGTETNNGGSALINATGLAGNDFMVFGIRTSVSAAELSAIADYHANGGSIFLFGDGNPAFNIYNTAVNSVLSAIGSTMSLSLTSNFDNAGYTTMSGSNFIGTGPYAAGMTSWQTAYASSINLGLGSAVISGVADNGFGVAVAIENANPVSVPEPTSLLLLGLGLLGFGLNRKRVLS